MGVGSVGEVVVFVVVVGGIGNGTTVLGGRYRSIALRRDGVSAVLRV